MTQRRPSFRYLPNRSKFILGATSPWMLVASRFGIAHGNSILASVLVCCFLFSALFWANPVNGSSIHILDKISARLFIGVALLVCRHAPSAFFFFPISILLFCLVGHSSYLRNHFSLHLCSHLLFRFSAFWWALCAVLGSPPSLLVFLRLSLFYLAHILFCYVLLTEAWVCSNFLLSYTLCISLFIPFLFSTISDIIPLHHDAEPFFCDAPHCDLNANALVFRHEILTRLLNNFSSHTMAP